VAAAAAGNWEKVMSEPTIAQSAERLLVPQFLMRVSGRWYRIFHSPSERITLDYTTLPTPQAVALVEEWFPLSRARFVHMDRLPSADGALRRIRIGVRFRGWEYLEERVLQDDAYHYISLIEARMLAEHRLPGQLIPELSSLTT
jgi:hypothetical protein